MKQKTVNSVPARKFAPVPFEIADESEVTVAFTDGKLARLSWYANAIEQLRAGAGVLRFSSVRCRGQITARAKKIGVRLLFAEQNGNLYVKLADPAQATLGKIVAQLPTHGGGAMTVREGIRQAIREAPRTNAEICDRVQELLPGSSRESITTTLSQLRQRNEIAKGDDLKWRLTGPHGRVA